jgi:hypothetical protein
MADGNVITWNMLDEVIDDTLCDAFSNYLFEDLEKLRHNYVEDDRATSWYRFKRKYVDLDCDEKWEYFNTKKFKYN